jgi:Na+/phosphate symporter
MQVEMKIDTKEKLKALYEMATDTEDFILSMQTAFIYNTSKPLKGCKKKAEEYKKEVAHLSKFISSIAADDPDLKPYVSVPSNLLRVLENLEKLSKLIDEKIKKNILFSDKALNETIYLLQRLVEIMRPTADMILARNTFLSQYIQTSQSGLEKDATEYATLHENRLVTGECMPATSSIYVSMLEAIKSIAWHTKEIAVTLS